MVMSLVKTTRNVLRGYDVWYLHNGYLKRSFNGVLKFVEVAVIFL
uniref:Uncharacterized protein n=1 Tax=Rhizophora mucronata TaxID=61149 RepID=A0A2P2J0P5_RHIMU